MPTAHDILSRKGSLIYSIAPTATVLEATNRMNHHKIGALMVMNDGKIVEMANSDDIYLRPQHPYTQKLLSSIPKGWEGSHPKNG